MSTRWLPPPDDTPLIEGPLVLRRGHEDEGPGVYLLASSCGRLMIGRALRVQQSLDAIRSDACCGITLLGAWGMEFLTDAVHFERAILSALAHRRLRSRTEWHRCESWEEAAHIRSMISFAWKAWSDDWHVAQPAGLDRERTAREFFQELVPQYVP
jgi:hypothetical protein